MTETTNISSYSIQLFIAIAIALLICITLTVYLSPYYMLLIIVIGIIYYFINKNKIPKETQSIKQVSTNSIKTLLEIIWNLKYTIFIFIYIILYFVIFEKYLKNNNFLNEKIIGNTSLGYIISIIMILITFGIFYLNINYDNYFTNNIIFKIKNFTLYGIFIIYLILLFSINPENVLQNYYGVLLTISLVISIIGFLMTITSHINKEMIPLPQNSQINSTNSITFYLTILVITITIIYILTTLFSSTSQSTSIKIIMGFIYFLYFIYICVFQITSLQYNSKEITDISKYVLYVIAGIVSIGIVIYLLFYFSVSSYKITSSSLIFNLIILMLIFTFIYKYISQSEYYQNNNYAKLFIDIILYVPCLLNGLFDLIRGIPIKNIKLPFSSISSLNNDKSNATYYVIIVLIIMTYVIYFGLIPIYSHKNDTQNGNLILINPISLNKEQIIASYQELNNIHPENNYGSPSSPITNEVIYNYKYAFSFWFNINSVQTFIGQGYDKYVNILNYNYIPQILYNPFTNTLKITMLNKDNTSDIIYTNNNILLQKWNNLIINYSGGILDIFINGILEKSINNVIPAMSLGNLIVGEYSGVSGGICNLLFFNRILNISEIQNLYNSMKNKNPPIPYYSNKAVIKNASLITSDNDNKPNTVVQSENNENISNNETDKSVKIDIINEKLNPDSLNYIPYISSRWVS
jgi:hypothetical protein